MFFHFGVRNCTQIYNCLIVLSDINLIMKFEMVLFFIYLLHELHEVRFKFNYAHFYLVGDIEMKIRENICSNVFIPKICT